MEKPSVRFIVSIISLVGLAAGLIFIGYVDNKNTSDSILVESVNDESLLKTDLVVTENGEKTVVLNDDTQYKSFGTENSVSVEFNKPKELKLSAHLFSADVQEPPDRPVSYFGIGFIKGGKYNGLELVALKIPIIAEVYDEPYFFMTVIRNGDKYIILGKHSDFWYGHTESIDLSSYYLNPAVVSFDPEYILKDLLPPEKLHDPIKGVFFKKAPYFPKQTFFNPESSGLTPLFTEDRLGIVYSQNQDVSKKPVYPYSLNGFYASLPDLKPIAYQMEIPFQSSEIGVPDITWNSSEINSQEYTYVGIGGCGFNNFAEVIDNSEIQSLSLESIGVAKNGDTIYGMGVINQKFLDGLYISELYSREISSYEKFLEDKGVFFWYDMYGRLIQFRSQKYMLAVECGKPVIYLYPEKKMDVDVKIFPAGGFSVTIPEYNDGWLVVANPDGSIVNKADQKKYPYLFWEGRGGIYKKTEKGFVVAQKDVSLFLQKSLTKLGLNDSEIFDFKEFWLPRMKDGKYYFISFVGTNTMNKLAPLNISPKPDSVIRILMDFIPLEEKINVEPQILITPKRQGFTVVEWGGVLAK